MMVGNSLKSDVVPAHRGGQLGRLRAARLTWVLEHVEAPVDEPRFRQIADLGQLPELARKYHELIVRLAADQAIDHRLQPLGRDRLGNHHVDRRSIAPGSPACRSWSTAG